MVRCENGQMAVTSHLSNQSYDLPAHTKAALRRAGVAQIVSFP